MSTVKTYYLKREMEVKDGIWGVLTDDEGLELYTLENADKKIPDGKYRGYNDGRLAVWKSKDAHKEYMESLVGHDLHTLVVTTEQESDDE
jgi:hypothetical protein